MIRWTYAFIDRPDLAVAGAFWTEITGTRLSPPRGDADEFVTLLPMSGAAAASTARRPGVAQGTAVTAERVTADHDGPGDAYLKMQVVPGPGGTHLDLSVDDVAEFLPWARALGATDLAVHDGWATLRSPSGMPFCVVPWHGETDRPEPVVSPQGAPSVVDQVCVDVAPSAFDAEVAFWSGLTGWTSEAGARPEFHVVTPRPGLPVRILLQRLGDERPTGAHLDLACVDPPAVAAWHVSLGAEIVRDGTSWIVMRDPTGCVYCLTDRNPITGNGDD